MIEGYFGLPGAGKTYSMIARMIDNLGRRKNKKLPVYANMQLDIAHLRKITGWQGTFYLLEDWTQLVTAHDGLIILDELNLWMPSRVWAKVPGALLWKWAQVRKSGLEIWYTAQSPKRVDKVVRELTFIGYHMTSFKLLNYFIGKVFAGIEDKFYCWNFIKFKKRHAKVYDTKAFIEIPAIYKGQLEAKEIMPFKIDEYKPKPKKIKKSIFNRIKNNDNEFDNVEKIDYEGLTRQYINNITAEDFEKILQAKRNIEKSQNDKTDFTKLFPAINE